MSDARTITAIGPAPEDPNLREVYVDDEIVTSIPATTIDALSIDVGDVWTDELDAEVRIEIEAAAARAEALRRLGSRDLSRGELIERLTRTDFGHEAIIRAVDQLEADKWLDDAALAESVVRKAMTRQAAGPALLIERLAARRIELGLAERIVAEALAEEDQVAAATKVAQRKLGDATDTASVRRTAALLGRRGFDDDTIATVLDRLGLAETRG